MLMFLWILVVILFILTILSFLRLKLYQHKLDVEGYTKTQLLNKISILKQERYQSKEKRAITTTYHLNLRNTKQLLSQLLEDFKSNDQITAYRIITTSQIAPKNPLYPFLAEFDFVIITNVGLILINIKSLKSKTFYHFEGKAPSPNESDLNQIVGHYLANQYHQQFQSDLNTSYTFNEIIQENQITYAFHTYDPYQVVEKATSQVQESIETLLQVPVSTVGVIYCVDQRGERVDGDAQPSSHVFTGENEQDLKDAIQHLIDTSHTHLSNDTIQQVVVALDSHHDANQSH